MISTQQKIFLKTFLMMLLPLSLSTSDLSAMKKNGWKKVNYKKPYKNRKSKVSSRFPFKGAGVLPYVKKNNKVYFLISKNAGGKNKGKWGDFGGGIEKKDTDIQDTAAREAFEESLGYFGDKSFWRKKLKHAKFDILENRKYKFAGISYVVDISEKVGETSLEKIIEGLAQSLQKYKQKAIQDPKKYRVYTEKDKFQWVDSEQLKMLSETYSYGVPLWQLKKRIQLAT